MCRKWSALFVILVSVVSTVFAARGTELIFRKTTTTTTEAPKEAESGTEINKEGQNETSVDVGDENKLKLTGIPQIDYIHDPNLPRELKGYNLSTYPFLEEVPPAEDLDFVCDGLHDGFYASVKFHCQLYHHCLYGIRYDFLCANFTAFDQKTFICHFASEVDCKNSPRYFYRNDALYKASTTTEAPTTKPPTTTTTTTTTTPKPHVYKVQRPYRRRPVIYDEYYYEDEYDQKPIRFRPRQQQHEVVDDYDFEDERIINRRPNNRKRKYYGGRRKSYAERVPVEYDYEYEEPPQVVRVPNKKQKINTSVLENRNKDNRSYNAEEKTQTVEEKEERTTQKTNNDNTKGGLFSNPQRPNPLRLGIKLRREPIASTNVEPAKINNKNTKQNVKEDPNPPPADIDYSYEDYPVELEEIEKPVTERVPVVKQSRLPLRKQYLQQRQ